MFCLYYLLYQTYYHPTILLTILKLTAYNKPPASRHKSAQYQPFLHHSNAAKPPRQPDLSPIKSKYNSLAGAGIIISTTIQFCYFRQRLKIKMNFYGYMPGFILVYFLVNHDFFNQSIECSCVQFRYIDVITDKVQPLLCITGQLTFVSQIFAVFGNSGLQLRLLPFEF